MKKKYWCVLVDRYLFLFNLLRETVQLKFEIDLRHTQITLQPADEVFRIKHGADTLFCQGMSLKEHDSWFK